MNSKWEGDSWEYLTTIDQKLEEKYVTMAEILRDNGYVTVAFQANVMMSARSGFAQGFDFYEHESLFHEEDALPYPPANRMYEAFTGNRTARVSRAISILCRAGHRRS